MSRNISPSKTRFTGKSSVKTDSKSTNSKNVSSSTGISINYKILNNNIYFILYYLKF